MDQTFGVESKNSLPSHRYWRFFSFFFHSNFIVLSSTLKFMVHFKFKLIFVWFRLRFFFFFLPVDVQLLQHHLLKEITLLYLPKTIFCLFNWPIFLEFHIILIVIVIISIEIRLNDFLHFITFQNRSKYSSSYLFM